MKKLFRLFVFAWVLAISNFYAFAQDEGDHFFDTRSEPGFGDATIPLREFLRVRRVAAANPQHFCIAGYRSATDVRAWIYWTEGQRLILWGGATNPASAKTSIALSRRSLDMRKDVVPTEDDIAGSSYRVTRAWAKRVIADCEGRGVKYKTTVTGK